MLKLGKKVEYALISLIHIGELEANALATARGIAEHYNIPPQVLGKVLQTLRRARLVESEKGVTGGYRLSRPLTRITLGEVIAAIDGPVHVAPCACETYVCSQEANCNIREPVFHFQDQLLRFVFGLSLAAFAERSSEQVPDLYRLVGEPQNN